jgi:hypothetical protein
VAIITLINKGSGCIGKGKSTFICCYLKTIRLELGMYWGISRLDHRLLKSSVALLSTGGYYNSNLFADTGNLLFFLPMFRALVFLTNAKF